MISSVFSNYKDVAHVLPTRKMTAEAPLVGLESIGFTVIAVVTDNNAINRKAMSLFANPSQISIVYPHPIDSSRVVHIIKCIRNNWINQKTASASMMYPPFNFDFIKSNNSPSVASFQSLRLLHTAEEDSLLKYAYKLSGKALNSSNLERQNVTYVLQVFNKFIAQALLALGTKCNIPN